MNVNSRILYLGSNNKKIYKLGAHQLETNEEEKDLDDLADLTTVKTKVILRCIRGGICIRGRYLDMRPHMEYCIQVRSPKFKELMQN